MELSIELEYSESNICGYTIHRSPQQGMDTRQTIFGLIKIDPNAYSFTLRDRFIDSYYVCIDGVGGFRWIIMDGKDIVQDIKEGKKLYTRIKKIRKV